MVLGVNYPITPKLLSVFDYLRFDILFKIFIRSFKKVSTCLIQADIENA